MFATCLDMPGSTEEMARRVDAEVGPDPVSGLIAHVSGPTADGWRIIDVWESEDAQQRFNSERLQPAVQAATAGRSAPPVPFDLRTVTGLDALCRTT